MVHGIDHHRRGRYPPTHRKSLQKVVLSLRQTDFQTLRAVKIGPLPCGGHASSATGGAVPARPLCVNHLGLGRTESSSPTNKILPPQPRQPANGRFMKRPYEKTDAATITP